MEFIIGVSHIKKMQSRNGKCQLLPEMESWEYNSEFQCMIMNSSPISTLNFQKNASTQFEEGNKIFSP